MEMVKSSKLPPSFIVETGKSYHCYWLAKDAEIGNFREIQQRLIYNFNADKANVDPSRVFRIPGFNHMKKDPFPVEIVSSNPELRYTEEQMRKAFPMPEKPKAPLLSIVVKPKGDGLWDMATAVNNRDMLMMLSGDPIVNGEQFDFKPRSGGGEHILVDGKPCDAWMDQAGLIGSPKGGGPTWIQWVTYYGRTKKEIAQWFKKKFPEHFLKSGAESLDSILKKIEDKANKPRMLWGVGKMEREATLISKGSYVMVVGETSSGKTPFTLQMAIANAEAGYNVAYFSLEMPNDSLLERCARNNLGFTIEDAKKNQIPMDVITQEVTRLYKSGVAFMEFSLNKIDDLIAKVVEGRYDMVVIDNIGYVRADVAKDVDTDKVVSRELVKLSRDHGITVIAIQHYRKKSGDRKVKGTQDMFRTLDAIMGSAKFSHDVTHVVQVARIMENATEEDAKKLFVLIQKDRDWDKLGLNVLEYRKGVFI